MGLCLEAARKLRLWSERLRKNESAESSTKHGVETFHFYASLFRGHLSIDTVSISLYA
jgi:hypothetical protein